MSKDEKTIALVYDAVFPFIKGGGERRVYEFGRRLSKQGFDVHLYGMKCWDGPRVIQLEGMTLHGISKFHSLYTSTGRRSITQAVSFGLACFKLLGEKFDILDCSSFPYFSLFSCRIVTWLKNKPLYSTWHEVWGKKYWENYLGVFGGTMAYWIEKISAQLPNVIISVSSHTTKNLRNVLGVKQEIITIPVGVDIDALRQSSNNDQQKSSDVLFVGRLLPYKNVDVLLHAVNILKAKNPKISLNIVGDGPERKNLQHLASDLGIQENISFLGTVEIDEVLYGIMQNSKILILPSSREGFGVVVIEANACGFPGHNDRS